MSKYGLTLPAVRGKQGDREFYLLSVPNAVLNNFFTVNMDPPEEKSQRQLDPKHATDIKTYLLANRRDYVLPTVVYAVDSECRFQQIGKEDVDIGTLTIPAGTNMRSLDGQHRRQGLNEAIAEDPTFSTDNTSILIYVEPSIQKRRQMFSDMNSTPKIVNKGLNIKFDSRNPFNLASVRLNADHPHFAGMFEEEAKRLPADSDKWYLLSALHDSLQRLVSGSSGRKSLANEYTEQDIYNIGKEFLDLLWDSRPEYADVVSGKISAADMRARSILFWGGGLRAVAGAIWTARITDGNKSIESYKGQVEYLNLASNNPVWVQIGFIAPGRTTPLEKHATLKAAGDEIYRQMGRR